VGRRTVDQHAALVRGLLRAELLDASERVPLADAAGRVAAEDLRSGVDLPLFRNSQMDGYAVQTADVTTVPVVLSVAGVVAAGDAAPAPLEPGTAVKVMTGATVPEGADAVIPVEDTEPVEDAVRIDRAREHGEFIRERGSDLRAGGVLVRAGTPLRSRHLAALAAAGVADVLVRRRLRVAVITTGAELVEPGTTPAAGQVFDANRPALAAAVEEEGGILAFSDRVDDDPGDFAAALTRAIAVADLVVTSGGISHGDFEVVRQVLGPLGADVVEIAMQPGGPQSTAVVEGVPVVSLPGNPVSTQVSFAVFVRPLLREAAGLPGVEPFPATVEQPFASVAGKRQYRRGRLGENGRVQLVAGPGSHLVAAMASSDVLIVVPEAATSVAAGDQVEVLPL
jgi:molybdopterin molybdotransferase